MSAPVSHTTGSIAAYLDGRPGSAPGSVELDGRGDLAITHLETLERAGKGALTFIRSRAYAQDWAKSGATAALISRGISAEGHDPSSRALIWVPDADLALNVVLELLATRSTARAPGVHASAVVDPAATVAPGASVGPNCTAEAGAVIGEGSVLVANVYLGHNARVGRACTLHAGVSVLDRCIIGDGCILHAGVVIGADGFGFRPAPDGRGVVKIPHIGHVEIGRAVEIGANSCVDRAKFGATIIGDGTKIDNLVQVGHGCRVGRSCLICGQVGLAGSVEIGDGAMLGGQAGAADNVRVGAGAMVAAQAGVMKDMPAGESWFGMPGGPAMAFFRDTATLRKLAQKMQDLRAQGIDPFARLIGGSGPGPTGPTPER